MPLKVPLVLDFDGSVGRPDGAAMVNLRSWQERVRFGCRSGVLKSLGGELAAYLGEAIGPVLLGSGDFHHLTWLLVRRLSARRPLRVVVFDNHPDNMRFPLGIHCGSWVRRVCALPGVRRVDVLGITSADVRSRNLWQHYLTPLLRKQLTYWCVGNQQLTAVPGLAARFRVFRTPMELLGAFAGELQPADEAVYLSIDKDVLSPAVARTNWDQGCFSEADLLVGMALLRGRLVGCDITGEVSAYRYRTPWKRWLAALDAQPAIPSTYLPIWQAQQRALNDRLLAELADY